MTQAVTATSCTIKALSVRAAGPDDLGALLVLGPDGRWLGWIIIDMPVTPGVRIGRQG